MRVSQLSPTSVKAPTGRFDTNKAIGSLASQWQIEATLARLRAGEEINHPDVLRTSEMIGAPASRAQEGNYDTEGR